MNTADLARFQGKSRLVLVFAPSAEDVHYKTQMADIAEHEQGLDERDVVLFSVLAEGTSQAGKESLTMAQAAALQAYFDVDPTAFMVVLVGKDGGVKLQKDQVISTQELFEKIDSMPVRQQEMQSSG
jgi:hypothetical protein